MSDPKIKHIYIPLCLYFNRMDSVRRPDARGIYIPLCLYFNISASIMRSCKSSFTFHYVSILICSKQPRKSRRTSFTFHYVSILIIFRWLIYFDCISIYIPLCLYFNHNTVFSFLRDFIIYIPLCLYFNELNSLSSPNPLLHLHSIMSLF